MAALSCCTSSPPPKTWDYLVTHLLWLCCFLSIAEVTFYPLCPDNERSLLALVNIWVGWLWYPRAKWSLTVHAPKLSSAIMLLMNTGNPAQTAETGRVCTPFNLYTASPCLPPPSLLPDRFTSQMFWTSPYPSLNCPPSILFFFPSVSFLPQQLYSVPLCHTEFIPCCSLTVSIPEPFFWPGFCLALCLSIFSHRTLFPLPSYSVFLPTSASTLKLSFVNVWNRIDMLSQLAIFLLTYLAARLVLTEWFIMDLLNSY